MPWQPNEQEIAPSEIVGRRIFTNDLLAEGETPKIKWETFYDSRLDSDLSFDRLGRSNAEKKILRALTKIADSHAEIIGKEFTGWAQIRAKALVDRALTLIPTPIKHNQEDGSTDLENPYHCDLDRANFRQRVQAEALAFMLVALFEQQAFVGRV